MVYHYHSELGNAKVLTKKVSITQTTDLQIFPQHVPTFKPLRIPIKSNSTISSASTSRRKSHFRMRGRGQARCRKNGQETGKNGRKYRLKL
jgi:hypothetical protein